MNVVSRILNEAASRVLLRKQAEATKALAKYHEAVAASNGTVTAVAWKELAHARESLRVAKVFEEVLKEAQKK